MDELHEFRRNVLEVLRQPMEGRTMTISRARFSIEYPASFMLVASMNPFPCGYYNHPDRECVCVAGQAEPITQIRKRIVRARQIKESRFSNMDTIHCNAQMNTRLMAEFCYPDNAGLALLKNAMDKLDLSARAFNRILKVSRTIADLDGAENIHPHHIAEAINYRSLDREGWGG